MKTLKRGKKWILRIDYDELRKLFGVYPAPNISDPIECWYKENDREYVVWFWDISFSTKEELVLWRLVNNF